MERREFLSMLSGLSLGLSTGLTATKAFAADKVKVGVFPSSSALPYYVALKRVISLRSGSRWRR